MNLDRAADFINVLANLPITTDTEMTELMADEEDGDDISPDVLQGKTVSEFLNTPEMVRKVEIIATLNNPQIITIMEYADLSDDLAAAIFGTSLAHIKRIRRIYKSDDLWDPSDLILCAKLLKLKALNKNTMTTKSVPGTKVRDMFQRVIDAKGAPLCVETLRKEYDVSVHICTQYNRFSNDKPGFLPDGFKIDKIVINGRKYFKLIAR